MKLKSVDDMVEERYDKINRERANPRHILTFNIVKKGHTRDTLTALASDIRPLASTRELNYSDMMSAYKSQKAKTNSSSIIHRLPIHPSNLPAESITCIMSCLLDAWPDCCMLLASCFSEPRLGRFRLARNQTSPLAWRQ